MAEFDPYRKWLGIPPEEQPPNHYRLLGIGLFEVDADVISNAADRQMVHVRGYQSGKYSAESQQILNELAAARVCLLDGQRKSEYDRYLREMMAAREPHVPPSGTAAPPPPQPPPPPPPAMVGTMAMAPPVTPMIETDTSTAASPVAGTTNGHAARQKRSPLGFAVAGVAVILVLLLGFWAFSGNERSTPAPDDGSTTDAVASADSASGDEEADDGQELPPPEPRTSDLAHLASMVDEGARLSVPRRPMTGVVGQIRAFDGHTGAVRDVRFAPGSEFILSGGDDKTVRLWDVGGGADRRFEGAINPIRAVAFADNGQKIVAASVPAADLNGATLHVWPLAGGAELARIPLDDAKPASGIALSADGRLLVLGDANGNVCLYDLKQEKLIKQYAGHTGNVLAVDISRDGNRIVSGGEDGTIRVWQRNAEKQLTQLTGHEGPVLDVVLLPNETEVLSAGADNTLRRWDIQSGKQLNQYVGHRRAVTSVDVTDDGRFAVSASVDSTVRLWDLATAEEFYRFGKHRGPVNRARFAEGGRRAVSAGSDGTVRLWGLPEFPQPETPGTVAQQEVPKDQPAEVEPARAAIPDAAAQQKAEQTIRDEVFRDDFASASRPEQQLALAQKLLDEGRKPQEDPALVYVLLRLAWNAATRLGESEIALAAVDEIVQRYDVDAVAAKVKTMVSIAKTPGTSARKRAQVDAMLRVLDEAVAADNYAAADALVEQFDPLLIKVRDGALSKQVKARVEEVGAMKQAHQGVAEARQVLQATSDDPAASEKVGRYEALVKGNWETGLPKLAAAADPTLKQLAQAELAPPGDTAGKLNLADGWWQLADTLDETSQRQVKEHAATWYEQIVEQLQGVERTKVEGRLASFHGTEPATETTELPKVTGFNSRDAATKTALLKALGGNETSEKAVDRALKWFVGQQQPVYGSWSFSRAGADSGTLEDAPNASTALALMPFLAAGHTARRGEYKDTVGKGLRFLGSRMVPLGPNAATLYEAGASHMPSHALGTIVLCEAVGLNPDKQMRKVAQAAVNYIIGSQAADGGWGDRPSPPERVPDGSNVMATAWNVAALKAAEAAGMQVPRRSLQLATSYLDKLKSADGQGFRYDEARPRARPEATAAGMFARMYLGWPDDQKELVDFSRAVAAAGPHTRGGLLSNFFESEVMHQMRGPAWPGYNAALRDYLINLQSVQGATDGSWYIEDSDRMSRDGGRLLSTALAALILEVYYRQPPLYP